MTTPSDTSVSGFGPIMTIEPTTTHTHTAVVLHGRGSTGQEFSEDFMSSHLLTGKSLAEEFPSWRWVFPASKKLWSATFQEDMPAWFDVYSLTDRMQRSELQTEGIRASVRHIEEVLETETGRLGGRAEKLMLGGISQGAATGLFVLLRYMTAGTTLGGFFGASTWLPLADAIGQAAFPHQLAIPAKQDTASSTFIIVMVCVFLGYGADDAYVDPALSSQAAWVLGGFGLDVFLVEYTGAEDEGHWFQVPDEMEDIRTYLKVMAA